MRHTILTVDDEPANLRMLERLFRRDYNVITAESGDHALALFKESDVSLIISDQRMPGMTGTELLTEINSEDPDAIKIILTGYTDIEALIEAINDARVYRFVSKPWDPDKLKHIVRQALAEREKVLQQKRLLARLVDLVRSHPAVFGSTEADDYPERPVYSDVN